MEALMVFVAIFAVLSAAANLWLAGMFYHDREDRIDLREEIERKRNTIEDEAAALAQTHNRLVAAQQQLDSDLIDLQQRVLFMEGSTKR